MHLITSLLSIHCNIYFLTGQLEPMEKITLVKQIEYNGQYIEAAWPLGAAINDLSS